VLPRAAFLVHGGYDVLAVDLRGHGESGGTIVSPGILEARDILGAVRYIRSRGNNEPIAVLGVSYAAVASLIAAAQSPEIAAVMSDGAFTSGKQVNEDIGRHFLSDPKTNFWVRGLFWVSSCPGASQATALTYYIRSGVYLGSDLLSVLPWASRVPVPVLVISGEQDWIVPTAGARQIFSAIPNHQKELLIIPDAVHDTTYSTSPKFYEDTVLTFLATSIKDTRQVLNGR
jgi:pimeloyl-ACP methyl ester carboxylesterase